MEIGGESVLRMGRSESRLVQLNEGTYDVRIHYRSPRKGAALNDDHQGSAPDIGAYEAGQEMPHYGPRPLDMA